MPFTKAVSCLVHEYPPPENVLPEKKLMVNILVFLSENIEYHMDARFVVIEPISNRLHGYLCRIALRKPEDPRAYAAKSDALGSDCFRCIKAASIRTGEQSPIAFGRDAARDRPHRMDDPLRWEVIATRHLRHACRLRTPLLAHDAAAFGAQLDSRERVDRIVDAEMSRDPASEHLRVGGVHDSISRKRCDILRATG